MSKFYININEVIIASQIAELLNTYNNLSIKHTGDSILANNTKYLIDQNIVNGIVKVVSCVGVQKVNEHTTLIKHLCVHHDLRRLGIASRMIQSAINNISTQFVHMNIRSNNYPSLNLAEKNNFLIVAHRLKKTYYIITVGRKTNEY